MLDGGYITLSLLPPSTLTLKPRPTSTPTLTPTPTLTLTPILKPTPESTSRSMSEPALDQPHQIQHLTYPTSSELQELIHSRHSKEQRRSDWSRK